MDWRGVGLMFGCGVEYAVLCALSVEQEQPHAATAQLSWGRFLAPRRCSEVLIGHGDLHTKIP
jgi:hypothetical protein